METPTHTTAAPHRTDTVIGKAVKRTKDYGRMIRFSHTVFALPFAVAAAVLANRHVPVTASAVVWILVAMVGARSAAMGFNRIADAGYDAANPRTRDREIPSGKLTTAQAWVFVALASGVFIGAAAMLGKTCLILSVPVLMMLFGYSLTKRFTWLCHLYLGLAISLAPAGAWVAITGALSPDILLLCMALMFYIAGFDILYACQDTEHDRQMGLHAIPSRFGAERAMALAALCHVVSWCAFLGVWAAFDLGLVFLFTVAVIGVLMIVEHRLVSPNDLTRIDLAFFHVNSVISIMLMVGIIADDIVRKML